MRLTNAKREKLLKYAIENTNLDENIVKLYQSKYEEAKDAVRAGVDEAFPKADMQVLKKYRCINSYSYLLLKAKLSNDNSLVSFELKDGDEFLMPDSGNEWHGKTVECSDSIITKVEKYKKAREEYLDHKRQRKSDFKAIIYSVTTFKRLCEVCDLFEGASNLFTSGTSITVLDRHLNNRVAKYRK